MAREPQVRSDGRTWTLVDWYGVDFPLLSPVELKQQALEEAGYEREPVRSAAIDLLEACSFEYEVVAGKDAISWLLGVVIHTDPEHARRLADHSDPAVHAVYGILLNVCPDFGADRVVAHEKLDNRP